MKKNKILILAFSLLFLMFGFKGGASAAGEKYQVTLEVRILDKDKEAFYLKNPDIGLEAILSVTENGREISVSRAPISGSGTAVLRTNRLISTGRGKITIRNSGTQDRLLKELMYFVNWADDPNNTTRPGGEIAVYKNENFYLEYSEREKKYQFIPEPTEEIEETETEEEQQQRLYLSIFGNVNFDGQYPIEIRRDTNIEFIQNNKVLQRGFLNQETQKFEFTIPVGDLSFSGSPIYLIVSNKNFYPEGIYFSAIDIFDLREATKNGFEFNLRYNQVLIPIEEGFPILLLSFFIILGGILIFGVILFKNKYENLKF